MLNRFDTNPTQLVGILAFAAATIACLVASKRSRLYDGRTWMTLAFVNCLCLVEIFIGLRHRIHAMGVSILMANDKYGQRDPMQEIVIFLFAAVALVCVVLILYWYKTAGPAVRVATSITIAVLALFSIEAVSLHTIDAIFYRSIGSVLLIGWIWALASLAIVCAALFA
jgi:hypothetical protein